MLPRVRRVGNDQRYIEYLKLDGIVFESHGHSAKIGNRGQFVVHAGEHDKSAKGRHVRRYRRFFQVSRREPWRAMVITIEYQAIDLQAAKC
jgi:hypothetical protein